MTIIKTWFGEIELHNGQIVRSNVLQTDAVAIALQLQREEFTDLDKRCRSRLREMAIQLGLVTSEHDYISLLRAVAIQLSLIHISEPTRLGMISYAVFCL